MIVCMSHKHFKWDQICSLPTVSNNHMPFQSNVCDLLWSNNIPLCRIPTPWKCLRTELLKSTCFSAHSLIKYKSCPSSIAPRWLHLCFYHDQCCDFQTNMVTFHVLSYLYELNLEPEKELWFRAYLSESWKKRWMSSIIRQFKIRETCYIWF